MPIAMNDEKSARQMSTSRPTFSNESALPYSQMASVSIDVSATTQYPARTLTAPSKKLQRSTVSVLAVRIRFEIVTSTPPVPMPRRASPMTRYV